jgi:fructokinase
MDHLKKARPVIFGEVLFDCFPDGSEILGGAPFNVAWHLQAFGADPLFISSIGNDSFGQRIIEAMQQWGMDSSGIQTDTQHPTGKVVITFQGKDHSFAIADHSAYDYINTANLPVLPEDYFVYHGSLALRHVTSRDTLDQIRNNHPSFIDINLRRPWWKKDEITALLGQASWIKLNQDELDIVIPDTQALDDQIAQLQTRFPASLYIITQGDKGAMAIDKNGKQVSVQPEIQHKVIDTVGAGDAFTSVILMGILNDWPMEIMLDRAQSFASAITGIRGATSTDRDFYDSFLSAWKL